MSGRKYNKYLTGMRTTLKDKMFFLNYININDYETIIDFGSGEGIVIEEIAKIIKNKNTILIGIDKDPVMQELTKRRMSGYKNTYIQVEDLETLNTKGKKALIIFSSVLHEVGDYWRTIQKWLRENKPTMVIRDMYFNDYRELNVIEVVKYAKMFPNNFIDFVNKYCKDNWLGMDDIYHYLLKYTYVDSWELELEENYKSVPWHLIQKLYGNVIHDRKFTLEYKKKQVYNDFGIELTSPTHREYIVELK